MITVLLWILGCYVAAAAVVYVFSAMRLGRERRAKHYVLIAGNEGARMEWYMRSLRRFSHMTGTDVKVTIVDNGSEDDTLSIARVFAKHGMNVRVHAGESAEMMANRMDVGPGDGTRGHEAVRETTSAAELPPLAPASPVEKADEAKKHDGHPGKWQRLRAVWRWRVGGRGAASAGLDGSGQSGKSSGKPLEPTHLLWMLQAEGIVSEREHAVLIDLRDPADLSKLPF
ncbi:glycosyltransferase family A protein [Paenibacillus glycinis]|uniref:Glycosyltransferase 2-like domain-containing protein n=1 Tax=Paenibacillus glycinis TaxID=2697035 RepID=A0ABW9XVL3_9BACL|nr:glycosyltransferase family A protein [Paenibacillus glycinis]NBD26724.1 hypothetical protein [Paenibacillus glycinis]